MNRFPAIVLIILVICSFAVNAQEAQMGKPPRTEFGVNGGINVSWLSKAIYDEPRAKVGPLLGLYLKTQIGRSFYFRPELNYSNQGYKERYDYYIGADKNKASLTMTLHYLNVPLLFEIGRKVDFQFGGQVGFLLSAKRKDISDDQRIIVKADPGMRSMDLGLVAGVGYRLNERIHVGTRLNYSVISIYNVALMGGGSVPDVRNRVLNFYISRSF